MPWSESLGSDCRVKPSQGSPFQTGVSDDSLSGVWKGRDQPSRMYDGRRRLRDEGKDYVIGGAPIDHRTSWLLEGKQAVQQD